jgi:hypothetical protein
MALTCVDLLYDKAKLAKEITKTLRPPFHQATTRAS